MQTPVYVSGLHMPSVVSFDVGGTLITGGGTGFCSAVCQSLGRSIESVRPLLVRHFLTSGRSMAAALEAFYDELGVPDGLRPPPPEIATSSTLADDAIECLRELRDRGFRVITFSNCTAWESVVPLPPALNSLVDRSFRSWELGWAKPDSKAFAAVADELEVPPCEFIHVGDSWGADMLGALDSGWNAVFLDRSGSRSQRSEGVPVVRSLSQLGQILRDREGL